MFYPHGDKYTASFKTVPAYFFRVTNILMIFSLQKLLSSVKTMEPEADSLRDQAQLLAQSTSEPRVISLAAQLSSRFITLLNNARVSILCFKVVFTQLN